jgi:hypothetical protein
MSEQKTEVVELTPLEIDTLVALIEHELQGAKPLLDLANKLRAARGGSQPHPTRPTEQRQRG